MVESVFKSPTYARHFRKSFSPPPHQNITSFPSHKLNISNISNVLFRHFTRVLSIAQSNTHKFTSLIESPNLVNITPILLWWNKFWTNLLSLTSNAHRFKCENGAYSLFKMILLLCDSGTYYFVSHMHMTYLKQISSVIERQRWVDRIIWCGIRKKRLSK